MNPKPHAKPSANTTASIDDQVASLAKHASKIRLTGAMTGATGGNARDKDKADRATTEQVLDKRTELNLLKLINRGEISEIHGVIATGKEANVYHAIAEPDTEDAAPVHRAVKIYKTAILSFKDRAKYVEGEHRFSQGYSKSNNLAMVKMWADKERRNLIRLHDAGIPSPEALSLRHNVLIMGLVGDRKGNAAPKLRDVRFNDLSADEEDTKWTDLYVQLLGYMRVLYQTCRLVHADLSEYNILYHENKQWLIDVSQAVEHDHPRSLEFLRKDVKNVSDFYRSRNVETLSERKAFTLITSKTDTASKTDTKTQPTQAEVEQQVRLLLAQKPLTDAEKRKDEEDDEVFRHQFIPKTLDEVYDIERDGELFNNGDGAALPYQALLADKIAKPSASDESDDLSDDLSDDNTDSGSEVDQSIFDKGPSRGKKHLDHEDKLAHKKAVKAANAEKRESKMKKHVKKKLVSQSSRKR